MDDLKVTSIISTNDPSKKQYNKQSKGYRLNIRQHVVPNTMDPELLAWKRRYEGITKIDVRV